MGIKNMEVLIDDEPKLPVKACPNIYHTHRAHEWGEKGQVFLYEGLVTKSQ